MSRTRFLVVGLAALCLLQAPAAGAAPITYQSADKINQTPVSADTPLPITIISGGGGGGSGTEYTEDAAAAANPVGGIIICRRRDTLSASEVSADLDNIALNCTAKGQAHVFAEIAAGGSVGILTATTTAAPSYTNGTSNLASTDTHGGLRTTLQDSTGAGIDFAYGVTSTSGSSTVTTGGTFQSALASNANRKGCLIQNPATATENLFVFFGATGSATTATSFSLPAGAAISCATGAGFVLTDNVALTGATTGHAYILVSQ